ncbi:hybrid sensor histidine kinase/response regulator [bacterium]|nr:hybrid sensor histidine kinase/response regulator [bacterium]
MKFDRSTFIQKFVLETRDNLQRLNDSVLRLEKTPSNHEALDTMMRTIHTIKGSAKMLNFQTISTLAHDFEDAAYAMSKRKQEFSGAVIDIFLQTFDRLNALVDDVLNDQEAAADISDIQQKLIALAQNQPVESAKTPAKSDIPKEPVKSAIDKASFVTKFADEAQEHVQSIRDEFESLKKNSAHTESLQAALRAAHTLKGSARMLKFETLSAIALRVENILAAFQNKKITLTPLVKTAVEEALQLLSGLSDQVRSTGSDHFANTAVLDALDGVARNAKMDSETLIKIFASKETKPVVLTSGETDDSGVADRLGERLVQAGLLSREQLIHANQTTDTSVPLGERLIALGYLTREQLHLMLKEQKTSRELLGHAQITTTEVDLPASPKEDRRADVDQTIRIRIDKLDALIRATGELITSQMRNTDHLKNLRQAYITLKHFIKKIETGYVPAYRNENFSLEHSSFTAWSHEIIEEGILALAQMEALWKDGRENAATLETLVNEVQQNVMGMRMVPLSTIFDAYPRAVRDLAKNLGKKLQFNLTGRETELDRKMVEKLNEPLIHLIRNAIDHGIETPEERARSGKPAEGSLSIAAYNEGNTILIEVQDDGRGIDIEKIKEKAVKKNLISGKDDISRFSENDLINFIFMPGFSTSDFITDISGRGYGMDIVKQCIESLKGYITVETKKNVGSKFSIHLPLTLTSLRALFVQAGKHKLAFPLSSITETIKIKRSDIIEVIEKNAIRVRNQLIPILVLTDILNVPNDGGIKQEEAFVIIAHASGERAGFIVDDIIDERDIIVKSLPDHFMRVQNISSATIATNNEIVLVLHVPDLIASTKDFSIREKPKMPKKSAQSILVVDDSLNTREVEKTILQAYGYEVDTAKDGLDAFEKIRQKHFDLIVTDLEMPLMDGFTLTSKIKNDKNYQHIPVIIVTSRDSSDDKRRGIDVGANAYIVKGSFDQTNLIDTVESLIG